MISHFNTPFKSLKFVAKSLKIIEDSNIYVEKMLLIDADGKK